MNHKFGRFSEATIRAAVANDRALATEATDGWRHSHGCVIDRDGTIVVMPNSDLPQRNLYRSDAGMNPTKDLANARFIVSARGSVERRCDMIEALLLHVAELEQKLGGWGTV